MWLRKPQFEKVLADDGYLSMSIRASEWLEKGNTRRNLVTKFVCSEGLTKLRIIQMWMRIPNWYTATSVSYGSTWFHQKWKNDHYFSSTLRICSCLRQVQNCVSNLPYSFGPRHWIYFSKREFPIWSKHGRNTVLYVLIALEQIKQAFSRQSQHRSLRS
jgi:hypothetical protein